MQVKLEQVVKSEYFNELIGNTKKFSCVRLLHEFNIGTILKFRTYSSVKTRMMSFLITETNYKKKHQEKIKYCHESFLVFFHEVIDYI